MHGADDPFAELTVRERQVLALLAIGRSDLGISETLFVTRKTVEFHTRNIFRKLGLPASNRDNRRVHAVLTFLQEEG
jgi:DNA-binding NarL/FixJ family response regulator